MVTGWRDAAFIPMKFELLRNADPELRERG